MVFILLTTINIKDRLANFIKYYQINNMIYLYNIDKNDYDYLNNYTF